MGLEPKDLTSVCLRVSEASGSQVLNESATEDPVSDAMKRALAHHRAGRVAEAHHAWS